MEHTDTLILIFKDFIVFELSPVFSFFLQREDFKAFRLQFFFWGGGLICL